MTDTGVFDAVEYWLGVLTEMKCKIILRINTLSQYNECYVHFLVPFFSSKDTVISPVYWISAGKTLGADVMTCYYFGFWNEKKSTI